MNTYCKSYRSPYVANVTALFDAVLQSQLSHTAIHLYLMLVATMNRQCWPDTIEMSDRVMAGQVGMTTRTLAAARHDLIEAGILVCHTAGAGCNTHCVYQLRQRDARMPHAMMQKSIAQPTAPLNRTPHALKTENQDKEKEEKKKSLALHERGGEKELTPDEVAPFLMGRTEWVATFCRNNGITPDQLRHRIGEFVRHLQNTATVSKEPNDALRHFALWYERIELFRYLRNRQQEEAAQQRLANEASNGWKKTKNCSTTKKTTNPTNPNTHGNLRLRHGHCGDEQAGTGTDVRSRPHAPCGCQPPDDMDTPSPHTHRGTPTHWLPQDRPRLHATASPPHRGLPRRTLMQRIQNNEWHFSKARVIAKRLHSKNR